MLGQKQALRQRGVNSSKHRGFTLFELVVLSVLISILAMVLLNRLIYYQELAEKADMEFKAAELKSGLRMRMAKLLIEGRAQEYGSLAQENPFDWLEKMPGNYVGQIADGNFKTIPAGNWYFDTASHTLVYLVKHGDYFKPDSTGEKRVRFQVKLVRNPPGVGVDQPFASVNLALVEPYQWF